MIACNTNLVAVAIRIAASVKMLAADIHSPVSQLMRRRGSRQFGTTARNRRNCLRPAVARREPSPVIDARRIQHTTTSAGALLEASSVPAAPPGRAKRKLFHVKHGAVQPLLEAPATWHDWTESHRAVLERPAPKVSPRRASRQHSHTSAFRRVASVIRVRVVTGALRVCRPTDDSRCEAPSSDEVSRETSPPARTCRGR
jgi:hypothetical protein